MNSQYIDVLKFATEEVLTTMANLVPEMDEPSIKKNAKAHGDVTGIMSLVGEKVKGSIAITFTKPVVLELLHRMLGLEITEMDDLAMDTTGEIANMVTGVTQRQLKDKFDLNLSISLPTVVVGDDHVVIHKFEGEKIILPFTTEAGKLYVEFCFQEL